MPRTLLATGIIVLGLTTPAQALNIGISAATPATFGTQLAPGQTVSSTLGTVTVTSVLGLTGWTLRVKDSVNAGHLVPGVTGCSGSDPSLDSNLTIHTPNPGYSSLSVAPRQAVTGSDTTIATYTPVVTLLSSVALTTDLQQTVGAAEVLRAGCVYSTTLTYTVQ